MFFNNQTGARLVIGQLPMPVIQFTTGLLPSETRNYWYVIQEGCISNGIT